MITRRTGAALVALLSCAAAPPAAAQSDSDSAGPGWNDARVLELVARARARRTGAAVDSTLLSYRAEARGRVYFFVDRPDAEDHVLVKADQVALELFWSAPDRTRQRIIGQRDEKVLPTTIRYHLDHLTVVQDDYGDRIRLGDGDEVSSVVHPMAPSSAAVYDFQLVDSLTLAYGTAGDEVRVYEIQVRPRSFDRAGFVGTVFVDRATASIVRMNFSFTPASYVDEYLDYIRISLDNSLWMGRHWLPYRQEVELRREMPLLDFSAGSVIRSRFEIFGYDFDTPVDPALFARRGVLALSPARRAAFSFEEGLFDEIDEEGLTVSPTMEAVRAQVREVVEDEVLSGLDPIRLHLDGLSDFARYNRAEGVFVGGGLTFRPRGDLRARVATGYAFGRKRPSARVALSSPAASGLDLSLRWDELGDIGGHPGATPLENTISAASGEKDFLDPYLRRGGSLSIGEAGRSSLTVTVERHLGARDVVSGGRETDFRPVRSIDEGTLASLAVTTRQGVPGGGTVTTTVEGGRLLDARGAANGRLDLLRVSADAEWAVGTDRDPWYGTLSVQGGATNDGAPAQAAFLLGGRHTLPGHDYRAFAGRRYWLGRVEATVPVRRPYLGVRGFAVAGATTRAGTLLPADWLATDSDGVRGSVGLGLAVGWDALRLDIAHGVRGGGWEAVFSVSERFRGWL